MKSISQLIQHLGIKKDFESKQLFNALKLMDNNVIFLNSKIRNIEKRNLQYFCNVQNSATQSLTNNSVVGFNTTIYPQFGNMHDDSVENTRIYIRRAGVYQISGGVIFSASALGTYRAIVIRVTRDGSAANIAGAQVPNTNVNIILNGARSYYLYENDFVDMIVQHDAGAGIDITSAARTYLSVSERMEELSPSNYGSIDPDENMR